MVNHMVDRKAEACATTFDVVAESGSTPTAVILREGGESSTLRLLDSITGVTEYWIARSSRAMTASVLRGPVGSQ